MRFVWMYSIEHQKNLPLETWMNKLMSFPLGITFIPWYVKLCKTTKTRLTLVTCVFAKDLLGLQLFYIRLLINDHDGFALVFVLCVADRIMDVL